MLGRPCFVTPMVRLPNFHFGNHPILVVLSILYSLVGLVLRCVLYELSALLSLLGVDSTQRVVVHMTRRIHVD